MKQKRARVVTSINGVLVTPSKAKVSVFDNALLYAEGLFETLLACEDRVLFLKEHLDRLYKGAAVLDLKPPVSRKRLTEWMKATARAHPDRIKKLRLTITSGESERWVGVAGKAQVILSAAPHTLPTQPFRLQVSDFKVDQDSKFRQVKTISYVIHAAAINRAQQDGFDDALMVNKKGHVAEVTSANIFWLRRGKLYTPPLAAGCLEGTTRHLVMRQAAKLGLAVVEKNEAVARMVEADEIFITSSLKLVIGVSEIVDGPRRYRCQSGKITQLLSERMNRLAGI